MDDKSLAQNKINAFEKGVTLGTEKENINRVKGKSGNRIPPTINKSHKTKNIIHNDLGMGMTGNELMVGRIYLSNGGSNSAGGTTFNKSNNRIRITNGDINMQGNTTNDDATINNHISYNASSNNTTSTSLNISAPNHLNPNRSSNPTNIDHNNLSINTTSTNTTATRPPLNQTKNVFRIKKTPT